VRLPDLRDWEVRRRRGIWRTAARRNGGVTTVVLDLGGVVLPTLFESVDLPGFPRGPLEDDAEYARVERGEASERDYWAGVGQRRPDLDIGRLQRCCTHVRGEMMTAIAAMLSRLRVVALTNDMSHWFGEREQWLERFPELGALDAVLEATRLGALKPAPEAYLRAAAAIGEEPRHCLLVDDLQANLDGAERVGMRTQPFDVRDPARSTADLLARLAIPAHQPPRVFGGAA
jgi:putative hydrolase of the HAD superfamily